MCLPQLASSVLGLLVLCWPQVQREYLDTQIRGLSNSHIVHPGIKRHKVPLLPAHTRIKEIAVPVKVGAAVVRTRTCISKPSKQA